MILYQNSKKFYKLSSLIKLSNFTIRDSEVNLNTSKLNEK